MSTSSVISPISHSSSSSLSTDMIIFIVISAVIFVTVVALYDVVRAYICNSYSERDHNEESFKASIVFVFFCTIVASLVGLITYLYYARS